MNKTKAKFKQKYGFWNLIPLIIGSIIGVGSYFKIGKILHATATILTWLVAIIVIEEQIEIIQIVNDSKHKSHFKIDVQKFKLQRFFSFVSCTSLRDCFVYVQETMNKY